MNKNITSQLGLPEEVVYCKKCTTSNQRPNTSVEFKNKKNKAKTFINFENGICDACRYAVIKKNKINWQEREKELINLLDSHRRNDGRYDVVVPGSGGKDSIVTAHILKYKYNMNPLLVTWPPLLPTDIGRRNFYAWLESGFANYTHYPNQKISKILSRLAFLNFLHPFQPFTIGQKNLAPKIALNYGIKLVFYGEHEGEYGSPIITTQSSKRDINSFASNLDNLKDIYLAGQSIPDLAKEFGLRKYDFEEYMPADIDLIHKNNVEFHYLGYFIKWHPQEMYYYSVENTNFVPNDERTEGSYSKYSSLDDKVDWLHYYARFIKFGQGRATQDSSSEIRNNDITRKDGISLVKKFDGEKPKIYLKDCLDYMGVSEQLFYDTIEKFRPQHLWKKQFGNWELKNPIWK